MAPGRVVPKTTRTPRGVMSKTSVITEWAPAEAGARERLMRLLALLGALVGAVVPRTACLLAIGGGCCLRHVSGESGSGNGQQQRRGNNQGKHSHSRYSCLGYGDTRTQPCRNGSGSRQRGAPAKRPACNDPATTSGTLLRPSRSVRPGHLGRLHQRKGELSNARHHIVATRGSHLDYHSPLSLQRGLMRGESGFQWPRLA